METVDPQNGSSPEGQKWPILSPLRNLTARQRRLFWIGAPVVSIALLVWLLLFAGLPGAEEIREFQPASTAKLGSIRWDRRSQNPVRVWVTLRQISPLLQQAVIISEDDLFYEHNGVNLQMLKEAFRVNLERGGYARGASTITMQLARNAFLHKRKTLLRKVRELILARRIENVLSKNKILELYLNIVEWGDNIYGAEAAARYYFGKAASQLNLSEASMLAGMLPNPVYFNPFKRLKSCQRMQHRVLWLMQVSRVITAEQKYFAQASGLALRGAPVPPDSALAAAQADSLELSLKALPDTLQAQVDVPELRLRASRMLDSLKIKP